MTPACQLAAPLAPLPVFFDPLADPPVFGTPLALLPVFFDPLADPPVFRS
jgi:hypothetical protein